MMQCGQAVGNAPCCHWAQEVSPQKPVSETQGTDDELWCARSCTWVTLCVPREVTNVREGAACWPQHF